MQPTFHWLDEVDSTNRAAERLLEQGCAEGTCIAARVQTAGRGRMGRDWSSPAGGLYLTVVLRPSGRPESLGWISIAGGQAAAEALEAMCKAAVRLKWPNDVLLNGRKVGGVLGEARSGISGSAVLLGVGLNLRMRPQELPERPVFPASTVLAETGVAIEPEDAARRVVERLAHWYGRLQREGPAPLRQRFAELSAHAGRRLEVLEEGRRIEGRDAGVSEGGSLLLETADGTLELRTGTIVRILDEECGLR